jgi:2-polyprenyl-3-methyl-5-hydroxy-6-metoxy-1,4-benzoquinol methylase
MTPMFNCIVCNNQKFLPVYGGMLNKCTSCGYVVANMEITDAVIKKTYTRNYFFGEEYFDYVKDKQILQLNFRKRLQFIQKNILKDEVIDNCLEIGCAYGFFGEIMVNEFHTEYTGIDVVAEAVSHSREAFGLNTHVGNYLEFPPPARPYSDVFMWDVIEHLQFPDKFLAKIASEIKPGGRIYITTGNFSSLLSKLQGKNWRLIHPPSHIHYFSTDNLSSLLNRYGFQVIEKKYFPIFRSIQQTLYSLFVLNHKSSIFMKLIRRLPASWNFSINTHDIFCLIAVKK